MDLEFGGFGLRDQWSHGSETKWCSDVIHCDVGVLSFLDVRCLQQAV